MNHNRRDMEFAMGHNAEPAQEEDYLNAAQQQSNFPTTVMFFGLTSDCDLSWALHKVMYIIR